VIRSVRSFFAFTQPVPEASQIISSGSAYSPVVVISFAGLATAITMTALFTDSVKNMVGMPRPDFFDRCFPDGVAV